MDAPIDSESAKLESVFMHLRHILGNCQNDQIDRMFDYLKIVTEYLKCQETRDLLVDAHLETLSEVINRLSSDIDGDCIEENRCQCLTECYRSLRNACAGCRSNQDQLISHQNCLESTRKIVQIIISSKSKHLNDSYTVLLRCAIQFLGNLVVGHSDNQNVVWNVFVSSFRDLMEYGDPKLTNYTCMVVHSCLCEVRGQTIHSVIDLDQFYPALLSVIKCLTEEDFEWGLYVVQDVITIGGFLEKIYKDLNNNEKLLVLEIMINQLKSVESEGYHDGYLPSVDNFSFLIHELKSNAYRVLTIGCSDLDQNLDPAITVKMLEVLCLATSYHKLYPQLQDDSDLITCCVYLLQSIHDIGKEGSNQFTSVTKASEAHTVDQDHPSYGLKRDLIRIIGNLSYRNRTNQDKVRELNGISLVLDLTNIDRKNPYITQWSVLAIHNLCEDNAENKAILQGLKLQGLDDNVNILRDFGIEAEIKDDKIHVKQTKKK